MGMVRILAKIAGWFFKILGISYDIKDSLKLLGISGGGAVVSGILAFIRNIPLPYLILIVVGVFASLAFIIRHLSKPAGGGLVDVPKLLQKIHSRTNKLREKAIKRGIDKSKVEAAILELFNEIGLRKEQREKLMGLEGRLPKRTEESILKHMESSLTEIDEPAIVINTYMARHDVGLGVVLNKDFLYNLYKQRLDDLHPMPNLQINADVEDYLHTSFSFNNLMVLREYNLPMVTKVLSPKISIKTETLPEIMGEKINTIGARLSQHIKEYLEQR